MPLRTTLTTIRSEEDVRVEDSKPVRTFLSDRALNKLNIPQTLEETAFDDAEDSPIPLRKLTPIVLGNHLKSEPKLFSEAYNKDDLRFSSCPSRSLTQVSSLRDSCSELFKNTTSGASDYTTAPLNDSTSFSTPPEDFMSSSNNGNNSNKSARRSSENNTTASNYLSCEEDSCQESCDVLESQTDVKLKDNVLSLVSSPENSTYCEFSSNKSDTNALSGSISSISGATVSDLSTDINDESQHETCDAAISVDDSPTRCSSSLPTLRNETKDLSQSTTDSEIKNINITIGQNKSTIREVSPSNSSQEKLVETACETASNETSAKCNILLPVDTANSEVNSNDNSSNSNSNSKDNKSDSLPDNNNATEDSTRDVQIVNLRNQIFRLERELILLQLDHSDAVDL